MMNMMIALPKRRPASMTTSLQVANPTMTGKSPRQAITATTGINQEQAGPTLTEISRRPAGPIPKRRGKDTLLRVQGTDNTASIQRETGTAASPQIRTVEVAELQMMITSQRCIR